MAAGNELGVKKVKSTITAEVTRKTSSVEDEYAVRFKVEIKDNVTKEEASDIAVAISQALKTSPVAKYTLKHSDSDEEDIVLDSDQQTIFDDKDGE